MFTSTRSPLCSVVIIDVPSTANCWTTNARTTSAEVIATTMTIRLQQAVALALAHGPHTVAFPVVVAFVDLAEHGAGGHVRHRRPRYRRRPVARRHDQSEAINFCDALVAAAQRVLAQHRALRLVIELEVHPVHRVVALALLGPLDELATQAGPRGLRRVVDGCLDVRVVAHPLDQATILQLVERAALAADVVVLQVERCTGDGRAAGRGGRNASNSRYLITQSTSRSSFRGSFSIVATQCSHISSAFCSSGGKPLASA